MQADKRTRTVIHHEWTLPSPAHSSEVDKAVLHARADATRRTGRSIDVWVKAQDDLVVIGYEEEQQRQDLAVPAPRDGES